MEPKITTTFHLVVISWRRNQFNHAIDLNWYLVWRWRNKCSECRKHQIWNAVCKWLRDREWIVGVLYLCIYIWGCVILCIYAKWLLELLRAILFTFLLSLEVFLRVDINVFEYMCMNINCGGLSENQNIFIHPIDSH